MNTDDIVADNIGAVGAIHTSSMFDALKAYDVADKLVELYVNGSLPVGHSGAGSLLYPYWRRAPNRMTAAERRSLYARTLGRPGGALAGDTASESNREFDGLWLRFVASVSELARQPATESPLDTAPNGTDPDSIGHQDVRAHARDLASNVSDHGASARAKAIAIDNQLRALIDLLSDQEIQTAYSARSLWHLVERVASRELGGSRSSVRYRTLAESGAVVFAWLSSRSPEFWTGGGDALDPEDIATERRSDNPRTRPSDYDLLEACDQWLAVNGDAWDSDDSGGDGGVEDAAPPAGLRITRDAVAALTSRSVGFAQMSPTAQAGIARDTVRIAEYLAVMESPKAFAALIEEIDFPHFVSDLINAVFAAIVDTSIRQMDAYAELIAAVAASVERFRDRQFSETELVAHLCEAYPPLCERQAGASGADSPEDDRSPASLDALAGGLWRRLASSRQQLMASVVFVGLGRVKRA